MSNLIKPLIDLLKAFSTILPLPWFTFIGAFVEEVIAPIPSPLVMTLAGSLAATAKSSWWYLSFLALVGAVGKTVGSYLIYMMANKAEGVIFNKLGKFIGVTNKEVEIIGKHLNQGRKDDWVLFLLRAIPIMPTAPVSVVCGLIKLNLRTYIVSTFWGTLVRNIFYIYLGFTSINALESINQGIDGLEKIGYLVLLIMLVIGMSYIYYHRKSNTGLKFLEKKG